MRKALWIGASVMILGAAFGASMVGLGVADPGGNRSDSSPAGAGAIDGSAATVVECLRGHGLAVAEVPTDADPNAYVVRLGNDDEAADSQALVEDCEDRFADDPAPAMHAELSDEEFMAAEKELLACLEEGGVEATSEMMRDPATRGEVMMRAASAGVGHCVGMVEGPSFEIDDLHFE